MLKAIQLTLVADTATPCLVKGNGSGTTLKNISGTVQDPLPVEIKNEDGASIIWVGGSDVDMTHGQSIGPGASKAMNLYGESEIPYVWSTDTPIVSVLVGRQ